MCDMSGYGEEALAFLRNLQQDGKVRSESELNRALRGFYDWYVGRATPIKRAGTRKFFPATTSIPVAPLLLGMSRAEMREVAKAEGLRGAQGMNPDELRAFLHNHFLQKRA